MTSRPQLLSGPDGSSVKSTLATIVARCRRAISGPPDEKLAALQGMEVFRGVKSKELRTLGSLLDAVEIDTGCVLDHEGRRSHTLLILLDGAAARSLGRHELGRLGPHSLIGAASLIYDEPAIATVTAVAPTRALVAGRAQFMAILALDAVTLRLEAATANGFRDHLNADEASLGSSGRPSLEPR